MKSEKFQMQFADLLASKITNMRSWSVVHLPDRGNAFNKHPMDVCICSCNWLRYILHNIESSNLQPPS